MKILKAFGFNENIWNWIEVILNSYCLIISLNDKLHDYFHCKRGVRQEYCISPLLLCFAKEVMSRGISRLVDEGKLDLIKGSRKPYVQKTIVISLIQGILIHNLSLYALLFSLLKDLERSIRNFIWSGDIEKRKLVIVA